MCVCVCICVREREKMGERVEVGDSGEGRRRRKFYNSPFFFRSFSYQKAQNVKKKATSYLFCVNFPQQNKNGKLKKRTMWHQTNFLGWGQLP